MVDAVSTSTEDTFWKFFKLYRSFKMYQDFLLTNDNYSLFIEPYRTCNLKCAYCYAEPSWKSDEKLSYERIKEVIKLYSIKDVRIFGGEPFLDSETLLSLFSDYPETNFFISSNGLALTEELVEGMNKVHCNLQISLEPVEWKQRVNWQDVPQFELLKSKWELINKLKRKVIFRLTIPVDKEISYVSLKEFVERIAIAKGDWNFIFVVWPAFGKTLPSWFDQWIKEGHQILDDKDLRYKFIDKHLWSTYLPRFDDFTMFPWYAVNCNAGIKSISLAPNGNLYACHEYAVVESEKYLLGKETLDKNEQFKVVSEYLNTINTKKECHNCDAKFLCGGICFTREIDSACEYMIKTISLVLRWIAYGRTREVVGWESKSRELASFVEENKKELSEFLKEDLWNQYCSGELPKEKVVELGNLLQNLLQSRPQNPSTL